MSGSMSFNPRVPICQRMPHPITVLSSLVVLEWKWVTACLEHVTLTSGQRNMYHPNGYLVFFFHAYTLVPHYGFGFYLIRQISSYKVARLTSVNKVGALNRYKNIWNVYFWLLMCLITVVLFVMTHKMHWACHKYSYARHAHDSSAPWRHGLYNGTYQPHEVGWFCVCV